MNSGPILQLISKGTEDIYLSDASLINTNDFVAMYKKFVPFSLVQKDVIFNENLRKFGQRSTAIIPRYGDLITKMYLDFGLPSLSIPEGSTFVAWTNSLGYALINEVEIQISGQTIDKQFGVFMEIWDELTSKVINTDNNYMIGKYKNLTALKLNAETHTKYSVPLNFWFCKNYSLALPLISLVYSEIKIIINLKQFSECILYDGNIAPLEVDFSYIHLREEVAFLSDEIRQNFAKRETFKYLVEQLKIGTSDVYVSGTTEFLIPVEFIHPVKELYWVLREIESENNNDWFNFAQRVPLWTPIKPLAQTFRLLVNGVNRFEDTDETYFRQNQPWQFHRNLPMEYIYSYSFSLKPEEINPSGTMNFSKINSTHLYCETAQSYNDESLPSFRIMVFSTNYNWLIIKGGAGGLAFYV